MTHPHATTAPDAHPASGAVRLAEQALLGALLRRPDLLDDLDGWLDATDFADPAHRAVHTAIQTCRDRTTSRDGATPTSRHAPNAVLTGVRAHLLDHRALPPGASPGQLLASLVDSATAATGPAHATRYARIVLHDSLRRQLLAWGTRLVHAAHTTEPEHALRDVTAAMAADLDHLAHKTQPRNERTHTLTSAAPARGAHGNRAVEPTATTAPPLPRALVERAERHLIHAVLADPVWQRDDILRRLQPEDFHAHPAHAATWQAIRELHDAGELIDPVLVAWHLTTTPTTTAAAALAGGLAPEHFAAMRHLPSGNTDRAFDTVIRAALIHHAQQANAAITAASSYLDAASMVTAAATAVGHVNDATRRLAAPRPADSHIGRALTPGAPPWPASRARRYPR